MANFIVSFRAQIRDARAALRRPAADARELSGERATCSVGESAFSRPKSSPFPGRYRPVPIEQAIRESISPLAGAVLPEPADFERLHASGKRPLFSSLALREARELLEVELVPGQREAVQGVTLSIDSYLSKDLDNALSFRREPDGLLIVGVHAVDLSAWIRPGSALDFGARRRTETRYLDGIVLPMLPLSLSEGKLSLFEGQLRLTKSVELRYTREGTLLGSRIFRSELVNQHRIDSEDAARAGRGEGRGERFPELAEAIDALTKLAAAAQGAANGSASIDQMLQTFTVASAKQVAEALSNAALEASFRNQERVSAKALYGTEATGHAMLGRYARWTGPMRRYADLDVQRAMDHLIDGVRCEGRTGALEHRLRQVQHERDNRQVQDPSGGFTYQMVELSRGDRSGP